MLSSYILIYSVSTCCFSQRSCAYKGFLVLSGAKGVCYKHNFVKYQKIMLKLCQKRGRGQS